MIYRKINTPLQYTFCSMEIFLQLDIICIKSQNSSVVNLGIDLTLCRPTYNLIPFQYLVVVITCINPVFIIKIKCSPH